LLTENTVPGMKWHQTSDLGAQLGTTVCWWTNSEIGGDPQQNSSGLINGNKANGSLGVIYCRPASNHPGGQNVVLGDDSVHFIRQDIRYYVYATLMAAVPQRVVDAKSNGSPLPNFAIDPNTNSQYILNSADYQ